MRSLVVAGLCLLGSSVATTALAAGSSERQLVQRVKDPATGLEVRVFIGGSADVSIEVGDRTVQIEKSLVHGAAVTTISTSAEHLRLTTDDTRRMTLDGSLGRIEATAGHPDRFDAIRRVLATSDAVRRAIALLGRLDLGPRSPVGHTLVTTRAMLLAESGSSQGAVDLSRWVRNARQALSLVPVSLQTGPGDCWKEYTIEAIATYDELQDCLRGLKWYEVGGELECGTLYDLRAIGAFSWYLHCVALR